MAKKIKIPGLFKKPVKKNLFDKKILKYIEQNSDKEFLQNSFELKDGFYTLIPLSDSKEDKTKLKKLSALAKDIKSNRALPVNFIPLAAIGIVVAGAVVFFTIFMNPLLEHVIESALENVFEAKVEVDNFKLNLLRFRISLSAIKIADKEAPMTNLFDMRRTEIRLLPQAVLRGKIYIEEVRADSIQFGTPRKYSGALPAKQKTENLAEPKPPSPPLVNLENFDAMVLINQQYDNLKTPKLYDDLSAFYVTANEKWTKQVDQSKQQISNLQSAAEPFIKFDINKIDVKNPATIQTVLKMIEDGKAMVENVQSSVEQADTIVHGLNDDLNTANGLVKSAQSSFNDDFNHLKSFLDLSGGAYREILDPAIQQILTGASRKYIAYGMRSLNAMNKLKSYQKDQKKNKPKKIVYKGRDVVFPTRTYPKFYLGVFASDFTINEWKSGFDLREVSSEPDLIGKPTTLKINIEELTGSKKIFAFNGKADFRSDISELYNAEITGKNIPFSLEKDFTSLKEIGMGGFKGALAFAVTSSGNKSGGIGFGGNLGVVSPELLDPSGTLAESIAEAIDEAGIVEIGFDWQHIAANEDDFSLNSNLIDLINAALKKAAAKYLKKAQQELERVLNEYITNYLKDKNISSDQLDGIFALAKGDMSSITSLQSTLKTKLAAMQEKTKVYADEKIDEAKEAAEKAAAEAKENVNAQLEEQKQRAQEEADAAQKKAQEEAARIKKQAEDEAKRKTEEAAKNAAKNAFGGKLSF
ncbi:MAG: hypothetical protein Ta2B_01950 [Termitinemataceae bacterium]|nr:MAG: hypothetical protein Ta2B_01950 [Termitinemataceae bacterium]